MNKPLAFMLLRYLTLLILGIFLSIFYIIFTPLTIYPVNFILNLIYTSNISGNSIILPSAIIEIVEACIAGSAYFLLLILNLSTPMELKKRTYSLLFIFVSLLIINIMRIIIFSILFVENFSLFYLTHKFFWYVLSAFLVIVIWITNIFIFKIKKIPVYSDFSRILKSVK